MAQYKSGEEGYLKSLKTLYQYEYHTPHLSLSLINDKQIMMITTTMVMFSDKNEDDAYHHADGHSS